MTESGLTGAGLVQAAVTSAVAAMTPYGAQDWTGTQARDLDLSCRDTLSHAVDCLQFFACQVVTARVEPGGTPYGLVPRTRTVRVARQWSAQQGVGLGCSKATSFEPASAAAWKI